MSVSDGSNDIPAHHSLGTVSIAARWALSRPGLLALFLSVGLLSALGGRSSPLAVAACLVFLVSAAIAHLSVPALAGDERAAVRSPARRVLRRLPSLVGVSIVYLAVTSVGLALFLVPGIYLGARLLLAFPACVIDETDLLESLERSWRLTDGVVLKLLGIAALAFALLVPAFALILTAVGANATIPQLGDSIAVRTLLASALAGGVALLIELSAARIYLERSA